VDFDNQLVAELVYGITKRAGRKAVLVASASGMRIATAIAETHRDLISDIVVLNASHHPDVPFGIRVHFIASGWSLWLAIAALPQVLRNIRIELIEEPGSVAPETVNRGASRLTCADRQPPVPES
jgi:pimeloyl-ACP methyl ester carboxylesterase